MQKRKYDTEPPTALRKYKEEDMQELLQRVNSDEKLKKLLKISSHTITLLSILVFAVTVLFAAHTSIIRAAKILISAAIPFIIVSVSRYIINAKRPYEVYTFYETPPKNKKGRSFPSRHVFSSFIIATLLITVGPIYAVIFYIVATLLAVCRVLLGIHFVRDVIAGAVMGIISGVIALLLI